MKRNKWFILLSFIFLGLSLGSILFFTSLDQAKWFDDGFDIFAGLILLNSGILIYSSYSKFKLKSLFYVSVGVIILAFQRVPQIFLQEWQLSINYNYPMILGISSGILYWSLADLVTTLGIFFMFLGFREAIK